MRSYKAVLSLPVPGARVNRPRYGHYFPDEGLVGGGIFSSLFVAVDKKGLAHLLGVSYEAKREFVCEKFFTQNSLNKTSTGTSPGINKITPTTV
jgi:hypothetical protein